MECVVGITPAVAVWSNVIVVFDIDSPSINESSYEV